MNRPSCHLKEEAHVIAQLFHVCKVCSLQPTGCKQLHAHTHRCSRLSADCHLAILVLHHVLLMHLR